MESDIIVFKRSSCDEDLLKAIKAHGQHFTIMQKGLLSEMFGGLNNVPWDAMGEYGIESEDLPLRLIQSHLYSNNDPSEHARSITQEAHDIINRRSEEKERQYGPMNASIKRTAKIATELGGKHVSSTTVFNVLIALKLSRMNDENPPKRDTYLDAVAYIQAKYNYQKEIRDGNKL